LLEQNDTTNLKGDYIILANHVSNYDPFYIQLFVKKHIKYIVNANVFRKPLLGAALNWFEYIPKKKFIADRSTVKRILNLKRNNAVIGIFPEGRRNWDGETSKIIFSTAKLIKMLKMPVVFCVIKGGYLSNPRWSRFNKKGRVEISLKLGLEVSEIEAKSIEEIYSDVCNSLNFSEIEYQKTKMVRFDGKSRAEQLELMLFICPTCNSIGSLKSEGHSITCNACNATAIYDMYGRLIISGNRGFLFSELYVWNNWQKEYVESLIRSIEGEAIFTDFEGVLMQENRNGRMKKIVKFNELALYKDRVVIKCSTQKNNINRISDCFLYPYENAETNINAHITVHGMSGVNISSNSILEFIFEDKYYHVKFKSKNVSVYKWSLAINILKGEILK